MSTEYHYLKEPVTGLVITGSLDDATLSHVEVWIEGRLAGILTMQVGDATTFCCALADTDNNLNRGQAPMHTYWGGVQAGCQVNENVRGLDPALSLISEYGEVFTVAEVRALHGSGAKP